MPDNNLFTKYGAPEGGLEIGWEVTDLLHDLVADSCRGEEIGLQFAEHGVGERRITVAAVDAGAEQPVRLLASLLRDSDVHACGERQEPSGHIRDGGMPEGRARGQTCADGGLGHLDILQDDV